MAENAGNSDVKLRRVLSLTDLVIYGIILIQPVAALPLFGEANHTSLGHAVTCITVAMVAMIFTAISYGRMANRYPAAGSAYTYVGKGLNLSLGFMSGWAMFLDYIMVPTLCTVFCSIQANLYVPVVPLWVWGIFFASLFTFLNAEGVKVTNTTNWILMIIMSVVVFWLMGAAIHFIWMKDGLSGLFTIEPFYHKSTFSWDIIGSGTALAALTYIGFDGLTTLSEEVENPRRNVLLATVLTCLITGIWSGSQLYLAQASVSWAEWPAFIKDISPIVGESNVLEKAINGIALLVGGKSLYFILFLILLIGSVGSGTAGMTGCSRVMYGMGRDKVLPQGFFGHLSKKHAVPIYNILLIGVIVLSLTYILDFSYGEVARLINFGAFMAFMLVNLASMREYYFKADIKTAKGFLRDFLPPFIGVIVCFWIWWSLPIKTKIIGFSWLAFGLIYISYRTKGFREKLEIKDVF